MKKIVLALLVVANLPFSAGAMNDAEKAAVATAGAVALTNSLATTNQANALKNYNDALDSGDPDKIARAEAELNSANALLESVAAGTAVGSVAALEVLACDSRYARMERRELARMARDCNRERRWRDRRDCREMVAVVAEGRRC